MLGTERLQDELGSHETERDVEVGGNEVGHAINRRTHCSEEVSEPNRCENEAVSLRPTVWLAVLTLVPAVAGSAVAEGAPRVLKPTQGVYRLSDGNFVSLLVNQGHLRVLEYASGEYRALQSKPHGLWVGGPGATVFTPISVRVRVQGVDRIAVDGESGLRLHPAEQMTSFTDRGVRFAARLLLPTGPGPFPGVVIVPGSVRANRWTYDLWAYFYAAHGVAVLTYDKRGVRGSGGIYDASSATSNLQTLAADALAGLAWLRLRPQIDPARVGLAGGSQAGWVTEIAAARSAAVRFVALQAAPAMSVDRQLGYAELTKWGQRDPPPTETQIQTLLANTPDGGYDPRRDIASLEIPVLWQLGASDRRMYTPETVADLQHIESSGTYDFTVDVYPGGAHSLRLTSNGLISEERSSPGFCPGVFQDLADWLRSHLRARQ